MVLGKRLLLWFTETGLQVLLLALLLTGLFGHDQYSFGRGLVVYAGEILIMFCVTGYLLTTIIARAIWSGTHSWLYPFLCTVLFVLHFELLNIGIGGAFAPSDRRTILIAAAIVAFLITLVGTLVLRPWTAVNSTYSRPKSSL
jgi:hypothetical protein